MSSLSYKCPNCGAPIGFSPESAQVECDFCRSHFTVEEVEAFNARGRAAATAREAELSQRQMGSEGTEQSAEQGPSSSEKARMRSYHCQSCGAEVVTDDTTAATSCYYCHNPIILEDRVSGEFQPQFILPFKISREEAEKKLLSWAGKKTYVPAAFTSRSQLEKLTGIYLPFWLAEGTVELDLQGQGEISESRRLSHEERITTSVYRFSRQGEVKLPNMLEMAYLKSDKVNPELVESVARYQLEELKPFALPYLSGFFAETRTVNEDEVRARFEQRMEAYGTDIARQSLSRFDKVSLDRDEHINQVDKPLTVLLPVWIMTYKFAGKTYVYALNGQTGEAFGELPLDQKKLGLSSLGIGLLVVLLLLLLLYYFF